MSETRDSDSFDNFVNLFQQSDLDSAESVDETKNVEIFDDPLLTDQLTDPLPPPLPQPQTNSPTLDIPINEGDVELGKSEIKQGKLAENLSKELLPNIVNYQSVRHQSTEKQSDSSKSKVENYLVEKDEGKLTDSKRMSLDGKKRKSLEELKSESIEERKRIDKKLVNIMDDMILEDKIKSEKTLDEINEEVLDELLHEDVEKVSEKSAKPSLSLAPLPPLISHTRKNHKIERKSSPVIFDPIKHDDKFRLSLTENRSNDQLHKSPSIEKRRSSEILLHRRSSSLENMKHLPKNIHLTAHHIDVNSALNKHDKEEDNEEIYSGFPSVIEEEITNEVEKRTSNVSLDGQNTPTEFKTPPRIRLSLSTSDDVNLNEKNDINEPVDTVILQPNKQYNFQIDRPETMDDTSYEMYNNEFILEDNPEIDTEDDFYRDYHDERLIELNDEMIVSQPLGKSIQIRTKPLKGIMKKKGSSTGHKNSVTFYADTIRRHDPASALINKDYIIYDSITNRHLIPTLLVDKAERKNNVKFIKGRKGVSNTVLQIIPNEYIQPLSIGSKRYKRYAPQNSQADERNIIIGENQPIIQSRPKHLIVPYERKNRKSFPGELHVVESALRQTVFDDSDYSDLIQIKKRTGKGKKSRKSLENKNLQRFSNEINDQKQQHLSSPLFNSPKNKSPKTKSPKTKSPKTKSPKNKSPRESLFKPDSPIVELPRKVSPEENLFKSDSPMAELPRIVSPKNEMKKNFPLEDESSIDIPTLKEQSVNKEIVTTVIEKSEEEHVGGECGVDELEKKDKCSKEESSKGEKCRSSISTATVGVETDEDLIKIHSEITCLDIINELNHYYSLDDLEKIITRLEKNKSSETIHRDDDSKRLNKFNESHDNVRHKVLYEKIEDALEKIDEIFKLTVNKNICQLNEPRIYQLKLKLLKEMVKGIRSKLKVDEKPCSETGLISIRSMISKGTVFPIIKHLANECVEIADLIRRRKNKNQIKPQKRSNIFESSSSSTTSTTNTPLPLIDEMRPNEMRRLMSSSSPSSTTSSEPAKIKRMIVVRSKSEIASENERMSKETEDLEQFNKNANTSTELIVDDSEGYYYDEEGHRMYYWMPKLQLYFDNKSDAYQFLNNRLSSQSN